MALPAQFAGHRLGKVEAPHVVEVYLDYTCPYSAKMFRTLLQLWTQIESTGKYQILFRNQVQPFHPCSTLLHEASLAFERLNKDKFWEFSSLLFDHQRSYFDEAVQDRTRIKIVESLAELAEKLGVNKNEFSALLLIPIATKPEEVKNGGCQVTNDLKWGIKLTRQNGIHVSPTVVVNGITDNVFSSSWTVEQWLEYVNKL